MKQKHLAGLAAFAVGVMGGAAFGDHHVGGPIGGPPQADCSQYPSWCYGQCAELNACRTGNTPIGVPDCHMQETNLASCETTPPPHVPPAIIFDPRPPACPAGQHLNDAECQADHECGDDEIGGGSEECEPCGEGSVPNDEGTACAAECGWDQIADPAAGNCVLRPFDDDAKSLAERVSNCGAGTLGSYLNHRIVTSVDGLPRHLYHYGQTKCLPMANNPPTSIAVTLHRAALEKSGGRTSSAWHWASLAVIHEFTHARDFAL